MRYLPILLVLVLCMSCQPSPYQDAEGPGAVRADSLADVLRDRFFQRDYEGGVLAGRAALGEVFTARLQAWYLINQAHYREPQAALSDARALIHARPESAWGWVAASMAAGQIRDSADWAVSASEQALTLAPDHATVRFAHCTALVEAGREADALAFLGAWPATPERDLCAARAYLALGKDFTPHRDAAMIDSAYAVFARVRARAPDLIDAYYLPAMRLKTVERADESLPLFDEALRRAPYAASVRMEHAHAVLAAPSVPDSERHPRIQRSIDEALALRPDGPETLYMVVDLYTDIADSLNRDRFEERLLEVEPRGPRSEWTMVRRNRRFADTHQQALYVDGDATARATYRAMLEAFIGRDWVVREDLLGEAYRNLFSIADTSISDEALRDIVQGMADYEMLNPHIAYHSGPLALAERGAYLRDAERIARQGTAAFEEQIEQFKDRFATDAEYERARRRAAWRTHDALGWIYVQEGRLDDAEAHLAEANLLVEGAVPEVLWHLGRLYEARYDSAVRGDETGGEADNTLDAEALFVTAFNYYKEGASKSYPGENPNDPALEAMYVKRNGSRDGFDDFLARFGAEDAAARKAAVLAGRLADGRRPGPFRLDGLDGRTYTEADLEGKVAVVNFWSISCGPCLWEMPEVQLLADRYRDEEDVVILTVADETVAGDTRQWMTDRGFTFPVLIDNGYRYDMGVYGIPHTWFIDRSGEIAYEKTGWTQHLLEEFGWRVESLR